MISVLRNFFLKHQVCQYSQKQTASVYDPHRFPNSRDGTNSTYTLHYQHTASQRKTISRAIDTIGQLIPNPIGKLLFVHIVITWNVKALQWLISNPRRSKDSPNDSETSTTEKTNARIDCSTKKEERGRYLNYKMKNVLLMTFYMQTRHE